MPQYNRLKRELMEPLDPIKKFTSPLIPPVNFAQFHRKPKNSAGMSWERLRVRRMNETQQKPLII
jgi:hypothetical protein